MPRKECSVMDERLQFVARFGRPDSTTRTVPKENSVQSTSHAIPRDEPQSRSSLWPSLSQTNEVCRGTGVQRRTVRTLVSEPQGEAARSLVDSGFSGSPPFD